MFNSSFESAPPTVPKLKTPSITPTVPQVSYLFDDLNIHDSGNRSKQQGGFPSTGFQTYHAQRMNLPEDYDRSPKSPPNIHRPTTYPSRSKSPSPKNRSNDAPVVKYHELESIMKNVTSECYEKLMEDLPDLIMKCLGNILSDKQIKKAEVLHKGTQVSPRRSDVSTSTYDLGFRITKSVDVATSTDDLKVNIASPRRQGSDASDSEQDFRGEHGPEMYKNAQKQLQRIFQNAEGYCPKEDPSAFVPTSNKRAEIRRPTPRRSYPVAMHVPQEIYRYPAISTDVSTCADAFLQRHLPPEKLEDCRPRYRNEVNKPGFAVLNMTNVSFAMGYPNGNEGTPKRERDYRGYHATPAHRFPEPTHHSPEWLEDPRHFRHGESVSPVHRGDQDWRYEQGGGGHDRILDLTAIRRLPKLL